ncbi:serine hydrolase [Fodinicola feengrottensis]|nr:serine hydrolase [Fodinicola feengrottensis]
MHDSSAPGDNPFIAGAHVHAYLPVDGYAVDTTEINPTIAGASGALVSTTADLDRFLAGLTGGRLLAPAQFAEMRRTLPFSSGYGLGFMQIPLTCGTAWGHAGGIQGFNTFAMTSLDGMRRVEAYATPYEPTAEASTAVRNLLDTAYCGG